VLLATGLALVVDRLNNYTALVNGAVVSNANVENPMLRIVSILLAAVALPFTLAWAEDGYDAWLRYRKVEDQVYLKQCLKVCGGIEMEANTPMLKSAERELVLGLASLFGKAPAGNGGSILLSVASNLVGKEEIKNLKAGGYIIRSLKVGGKRCTVITAGTDRGVLYGVFSFLRLIQTGVSLERLNIIDNPANGLRLYNHWDNPRGSVERGYAGPSIFRWEELPRLNRRYTDYARLLASTGINGMVINNVNTSKPGMIGWKLVSPEQIDKVVPLAGILRSYGIKIYISVGFAAPMRVGGLETADPLDAGVKAWWTTAADRIYSRIPDFGGFLVKADSEGEPGPHHYGRNHAEGANVMAAALKPHGGIVLWRAFVYGGEAANKDRAAQAFGFFKPLDGKFADNVVLQVKNGPVDFQVREPVAPLFGQMPETGLMLELQITQEYTGHSTHLCYLVPQWKSFLGFDTHANGPGATLATVVDGSVHGYAHSGIAGVSNFGDSRNWTGHDLAQANAYGYGRLAWNPGIPSEKITDEWIKMTFGTNPAVVETIREMMLGSWEAYENYTSPLGVGVMCDAEHYGPDPKGRTPFHCADKDGVGFDRTEATGSGYASQYHGPVKNMYESLETCPDEQLLFFHHVPYTHRLHSGKTVIQHIYDSHMDGVEAVDGYIAAWKSLKGRIDEERYERVLSRLEKQLKDASQWRDSINQYFLALSGIEDEKGRLGNLLH